MLFYAQLVRNRKMTGPFVFVLWTDLVRGVRGEDKHGIDKKKKKKRHLCQHAP